MIGMVEQTYESAAEESLEELRLEFQNGKVQLRSIAVETGGST